ncbi:hypothetical protein [Kitasatospora sp. NPDC059327]|uniref:hypothetical protein n=1 Tax=Kitasatospora sp. NPDC059327 TaxID=3346803 RepID=UPI00369EC045
MEAARAFHHAVRDDQDGLAAVVDRLRDATVSGDFAYLADVAYFMADLPLDYPSTTRWLDDEATVRHRWLTVADRRRQQINGTR